MFKLLRNHNRTQWGTSICMNEPPVNYCWVVKITTIGWDLTTGVHSYKDDEVGFKQRKRNSEN